MKKQTYIIVLLNVLLFISCVSIPNSTASLTQEIIIESDDMHQLNVVLINKLFIERRERINTFITNEYTPALIKNFEKLLPDTLNLKKELPNIMKSIIPIINRKKDSLQTVLNTQEKQILTRLNKNYSTYSKATNSLQDLINSVVKLKASENDILSSIKSLTNNSIDIKKAGNSVDDLLNKSGDTMQKLLEIKKTLNIN